jgi:hypothetical protein
MQYLAEPSAYAVGHRSGTAAHRGGRPRLCRSAFLVFWLAELACPMLNRPSPGRLNGPSWRHEQWVAQAARVGLWVVSETRRLTLKAPASLSQRPAACSVTVVGDHCI